MNPVVLFPITICVALETFQQIVYSFSEKRPNKRLVYIGVGIIAYLLMLLAWFWLLTLLPLGIASPIMGASYITVPIAGKIFFGEKIDIKHWCGILTIIIGLVLISEG